MPARGQRVRPEGPGAQRGQRVGPGGAGRGGGCGGEGRASQGSRTPTGGDCRGLGGRGRGAAGRLWARREEAAGSAAAERAWGSGLSQGLGRSTREVRVGAWRWEHSGAAGSTAPSLARHTSTGCAHVPGQGLRGVGPGALGRSRLEACAHGDLSAAHRHRSPPGRRPAGKGRVLSARLLLLWSGDAPSVGPGFLQAPALGFPHHWVWGPSQLNSENPGPALVAV